MRDLRDFWREQDHNPVPFEAAVQRAQDSLNEGGWKCLITAVEGLVLLRTLEHMTHGVTSPLNLDECQDALRTVSLGYSRPTDSFKRPRQRRSPASDAAPPNAWGPRKIAAVMALSETGVTRENIAPGSASALRVLSLLRAGLAAAQARRSKTSARAPARN